MQNPNASPEQNQELMRDTFEVPRFDSAPVTQEVATTPPPTVEQSPVAPEYGPEEDAFTVKRIAHIGEQVEYLREPVIVRGKEEYDRLFTWAA